MALAESTVSKLRDEALGVGGIVLDDGDEKPELDITRFDEDDDPLTLVGDFVDDGDDNAPVGQTGDED